VEVRRVKAAVMPAGLAWVARVPWPEGQRMVQEAVAVVIGMEAVAVV
jgi:hypothetical protein